MNEYEMRILIDELEKLVVSQSISLSVKDIEISNLKKEIESKEAQLKQDKENKN